MIVGRRVLLRVMGEIGKGNCPRGDKEGRGFIMRRDQKGERKVVRF